MAKVPQKRGNQAGRERWRFVSPVATLALATGTGLGVLIALYSAANKELSGLLLIVAVALGGVAVLLLTEAVNRARDGGAWGGAAAAGATIAIASLLLALLPDSDEVAAEPRGDLRLSLRTAEPEFYSVAFDREIPLPRPREDWSALHARGAIDVADTSFHMTLANDSSEPISVLGIRVLITKSGPVPDGTFAWHPAQGDEGLPQMTAVITGGRPGSSGRIFDGYLSAEAPLPSSTYFQTKYILLKPGEVYPVELTVRAKAARTIHYQLVATGKSANRQFVARSRAFKIVGELNDPDQSLFARYYRMGFLSFECTPTPDNPWVDVGPDARSPECPNGLLSPTDVPAPEGGFGIVPRTPWSR